jgi:hypothetical protein
VKLWENRVLVNEDADPVARALAAVVPAMIGVRRGERRRGNARLTDALFQLRANNFLAARSSVLSGKKIGTRKPARQVKQYLQRPRGATAT